METDQNIFTQFLALTTVKVFYSYFLNNNIQYHSSNGHGKYHDTNIFESITGLNMRVISAYMYRGQEKKLDLHFSFHIPNQKNSSFRKIFF
jgi:hypothetical protein